MTLESISNSTMNTHTVKESILLSLQRINGHAAQPLNGVFKAVSRDLLGDDAWLCLGESYRVVLTQSTSAKSLARDRLHTALPPHDLYAGVLNTALLPPNQ